MGKPELGQRWQAERRISLLLILLFTIALGSCAVAEPAPEPPRLAYTRTVDLSHVIRSDVPYLAAEPVTQITRNEANQVVQLQIGARTGSLLRLIAAPDADVQSLEQLSSRDLVVPAVVIDMRDYAQDQPDYRFSQADLLTWEAQYGAVPAGAFVLLSTGWDVRWGDPTAYLPYDPAGNLAVPGFAVETIALLFNERGAIGLGIDAPGVAYAPEAGYRLFLENLTSLEQLPPTGATLIIGALKIQAAQSSPARILALIP